MTSPAAILEFAKVTLEADPLYETGLWNISFELKPGALLLVRLEPEHERVPLADAAEGLVPPTEGRVCFLGDLEQRRFARHGPGQAVWLPDAHPGARGLMEKRFKFRHVNELTGAFVLAVLVLVIAGVLFSGRSQRWFSRKFAFDVLLPEKGAFGLSRGNEVFILGVSAGSVYDVHVMENGRIKAHVKIRGDFEPFVRVDSQATIKKVFGVAGDSFMEIARGVGEPLPSRGGTIVCLSSEELPGMMEKMLADLRAELMPVVKKTGAALDEWTTLAADLKKTQEDLHQLVERLDQLAAGVQEGRGTAGQLLTDTTLADEAQRLLARANQSMADLGVAITNVQGFVTNLQKGTARLPEITDKVADEAQELPGLVLQVQTTARELERLVEALQRHWLVRKYVNKTNPPPLRPLPATEPPRPAPVKAFRSPRGSTR